MLDFFLGFDVTLPSYHARFAIKHGIIYPTAQLPQINHSQKYKDVVGNKHMGVFEMVLSFLSHNTIHLITDTVLPAKSDSDVMFVYNC